MRTASIAAILPAQVVDRAGAFRSIRFDHQRRSDYRPRSPNRGRRYHLHAGRGPHPAIAGRAGRRRLPADRLPSRAGGGTYGGGVGAYDRQARGRDGNDARARERSTRPHQRDVDREPHPQYRRLLRSEELPSRHHAGDRSGRHCAHGNERRMAGSRSCAHPRSDVDSDTDGVRGSARAGASDCASGRAERDCRRRGTPLLRTGVVPAYATDSRATGRRGGGSAPAARG